VCRGSHSQCASRRVRHGEVVVGRFRGKGEGSLMLIVLKNRDRRRSHGLNDLRCVLVVQIERVGGIFPLKQLQYEIFEGVAAAAGAVVVWA